MTHASAAIANEFLKRAQFEGRELTHMHVQKLVYIAHGWSLATRNEPLVDELFQAWDYGPVIPSLYRALKRYGSGSVQRLIRRGDETDNIFDDGDVYEARLESSEKAVIDQIWNEFKVYEAFQLSALTHKDRSPWKAAMEKNGRNSLIGNHAIQDYFSELADTP